MNNGKIIIAVLAVALIGSMIIMKFAPKVDSPASISESAPAAPAGEPSRGPIVIYTTVPQAAQSAPAKPEDSKITFEASIQGAREEAEQCQKDLENIQRQYENRKRPGELDYAPNDLDEILSFLKSNSAHMFARKQLYDVMNSSKTDAESAGKSLQQMSEVPICNPAKKNQVIISVIKRIDHPDFKEYRPQIMGALRAYFEEEFKSTPGFGEFSMNFEVFKLMTQQKQLPKEFRESVSAMDKQ